MTAFCWRRLPGYEGVDRSRQLDEVQRLRKYRVRNDAHLFLWDRSDHDRRDVAEFRMLIQVREDVFAGDLRHEKIDENETRAYPSVQQIDRLLTVVGGENGVPALGQDGIEGGRRVCVIFDDDSTGIRHLLELLISFEVIARARPAANSSVTGR